MAFREENPEVPGWEAAKVAEATLADMAATADTAALEDPLVGMVAAPAVLVDTAAPADPLVGMVAAPADPLVGTADLEGMADMAGTEATPLQLFC